VTELLERAIARLQTLSENEQNAIASIILEEIEDERLWDESFSRSPMFSPGWQLRQWLNTMLEKPKNLIQKPCEVPHYCRVPQTVC